MKEVTFFLPYLAKYAFVQMAIDPEWMFPRRDGIPGVSLSNVRSSDLNPIIKAMAAIPMKDHVPRKILIIHQYRPDGDGLKNPYDAGQAEIADKGKLLLIRVLMWSYTWIALVAIVAIFRIRGFNTMSGFNKI